MSNTIVGIRSLISEMPDWSATVEQDCSISYASIKPIAVKFAQMSSYMRRSEVKRFSCHYCSPDFDFAQASRLYLLLRILFDLPTQQPVNRAKVFGGWHHLSVDEDKADFDLAWPVYVDASTLTIKIEPCRGYFGRNYDALGEYEYFNDHFLLRSKGVLDDLVEVSSHPYYTG